MKLLAILLSLGLASPLLAAPAGATQKLKSAVSGALSDYKADSKAQRELLELRLLLVEKQVQANGLVPATQDELLDAIADFQDGMWTAVAVARGTIAFGGKEALADFADGEALEGEYPEGFYPGDGGPLDDFVAARAKLDSKLYAKVTKRLAKTAKVLEEDGGRLLTVVLRPVASAAAFAFTEESTVELFPIGEVDTLVGVGLPDAVAGGLLVVGGMRFGSNAMVVSFTPPGDFVSDDEDVPSDGNDRWRFTNAGGGAGLTDGHWIVGIRLDGDAVPNNLTIGLR